MSLTQIVKRFNEKNVPGSIRSAKRWSAATISRILNNEKYAGRWICNRTEAARIRRPDDAGGSTSPSQSGWSTRTRSCGLQALSDRVDEGQSHQIWARLSSTPPHARLRSFATSSAPIRLEPVTPDIGRPLYRAVTALDALALIGEPPPVGAEGGSNSLRGGPGRKEFEPQRSCRSMRRSLTGLRCRST
jgi:Recombinase